MGISFQLKNLSKFYAIRAFLDACYELGSYRRCVAQLGSAGALSPPNFYLPIRHLYYIPLIKPSPLDLHIYP